MTDESRFTVEHHDAPKVPVLTPAQEALFERMLTAAQKFHPDPTRVLLEAELFDDGRWRPMQPGDHDGRVRLFAVGIRDADGNYHAFAERWPI